MQRFFRTRLGSFVLFIIFAIAANVVAGGVGYLIVNVLKLVDERDPTWHPTLFVWAESITALGALAATILVMQLSGRSFSDLGLSPAKLWRRLAAGSVWGFVMPTMLILAIFALGGFRFGSVAMSGMQLATYFFAWLGVMFLLGFAEEAVFRGPALTLLRDSIGFWPAAIVTSALFVVAHMDKPHENAIDLTSIGLIGLFLCFTVQRTGSIWWAVGFHALFDYAALYLYGAPNSGNNGGQPLPTRLLTGGFHGPDWLTGGRLGIEASALVFPLLALVWFAFDRMSRTQQEEEK